MTDLRSTSWILLNDIIHVVQNPDNSICKAFDSVVYSKLFTKLAGYGIKFELLAWLRSFLLDRLQCVCIDGFFSEFTTVVSGVPQGTVLAPLLFILFINDIADSIKHPSSCKLFADDVKLYTSFDLLDVNCGTSQLTSALLILEDWSRRWQLRIYTSKCSILHLGPHNPSLSYTLNHNPLPVANSVRDLGITFNCKLKFDEYINKIVSKAFQLVNLIFRSFVSRCPKIFCRAFKTYIRPILEYCTPVWSPYLLCDIKKN